MKTLTFLLLISFTLIGCSASIGTTPTRTTYVSSPAPTVSHTTVTSY